MSHRLSPVQVDLPPCAPRRHGRLARWFGRTLLRLGGWRVVGRFPDCKRLMIVVAPHSSAWDAFWGLAAKLAMGVDVRFMGKAELFRGPLGWLLGRLGGIATNRAAPGGIVGDMGRALAEADTLWLVIAPEGTRKPVQRWKTGFWRIARAAGVPVLCAYFHYPERTIGIGERFELGEDMEADIARIRDWYRPWKGRHRGVFRDRPGMGPPTNGGWLASRRCELGLM